jgi:hypothetical protein
LKQANDARIVNTPQIYDSADNGDQRIVATQLLGAAVRRRGSKAGHAATGGGDKRLGQRRGDGGGELARCGEDEEGEEVRLFSLGLLLQDGFNRFSLYFSGPPRDPTSPFYLFSGLVLAGSS